MINYFCSKCKRDFEVENLAHDQWAIVLDTGELSAQSWVEACTVPICPFDSMDLIPNFDL